MMRGEEEGYLRLAVTVEPEPAIEQLCRHFVKRGSRTMQQMHSAISDGYKRLIEPSIANETKNAAKMRADDEAIAVFAENLRQLLLSAPLGQKEEFFAGIGGNRRFMCYFSGRTDGFFHGSAV